MAEKPFGMRPLDELEDAQIVAACERNYIDYWACAGARPYSDFSESLGITRAITGLPNEIFNVVLKCRLGPGDVEQAIDVALDEFKARRIPLLWHVGLLTEPRDLGRRLEARGFPRDYDLRAMAVDLSSLDGPADPAPEGAGTEMVVTERQSMRWIDCLATSWHLPREVPQWMARNPCFNVAAGPGGAVPNRRMYLGLVGNEPVSASMLFWDGGIAGLQAVGTIPSAQKRGAGSAAVMAALRGARALGFRVVVVLSTVEGVRLYEKLGFRAFGVLPEHSMRFDQDR